MISVATPSDSPACLRVPEDVAANSVGSGRVLSPLQTYSLEEGAAVNE